jgi:long-chain acyl-CoA synthetase
MNPLVYTDLLKHAFEQYADRPCLNIKRNGVYQSWTYGAMRRDCSRLVSVLQKIKIGRETNIVVIGENSPEWIIAFHSIILSGARVVPVDPNLPVDEIAGIVTQTRPPIVFCSPAYLTVMRRFLSSSAHHFLHEIVVLGRQSQDGIPAFTRFIASGDPEHDCFARSFAPEDPMVIIFTSGTTGKAKGVVLMQKNYTTAGLHGIPRMKLDETDVVMAILPLHHVFGFAACIAAPITAGMSIVFVPVIKGPLIVEALIDKKITMLPAVPKMLTVLYDNIGRKVHGRGPLVRAVFALLRWISRLLGPLLGQAFRRRLFHSVHAGFGGNIRVIISGGASLAPAYFNGFRELGFNIVEGYGLTETCGPITLCPIDRPLQASVGPVLPHNEMQIDAPGHDGIGEVLLRGATVFAGYYDNPEATRAAIDGNGWFHTGDLGRLDKNGYLFLTGRSKDVIVLESGKNVYPDELEEFYETSNHIDEIAIFGETVKGREIVAALIVPSPDIRRKYTLEDAAEIIRNEMVRMGRNRPSYKKVTDFAIVYQPLPRTTTRKLRKPDIRKIYHDCRKGAGKSSGAGIRLTALEETLMASPEFVAIVNSAVRIKPTLAGKTITPRSNLELDLGLDPLQQIDLFSALEETCSLRIPEKMVANIETTGDLYAKLTEIRESAAVINPDQPTIRARLSAVNHPDLLAQHRAGIFYNVAPGAAAGLSRLFWKVAVHGIETIPAAGPLIFAANHEGLLDAVWIVSSLPWSIRKNTFSIGTAALLRHPLPAALLKRSNLIAVEREGDPLDALSASMAVLKQKKNLIIFPEGARSRDKKIRPFKAGIGMLMLETNATVIPIRIRSSADAWPVGRMPRLMTGHRGEASVTFGRALTVQSLIEADEITPYSTAGVVAEALQRVIAGM